MGDLTRPLHRFSSLSRTRKIITDTCIAFTISQVPV